MKEKKISQAVIKRLPKYYSCLRHLEEDNVAKISSSEIGKILDITPSQVRQDLCNFGGFGQQGYGYDVSKLKETIATILGLDKQYSLIIIGAGNIGRALLGYTGFKKHGFEVKAAFDVKTDNLKYDGIEVRHMDELAEYIRTHQVDIAVIATQKTVAQDVADEVIACGVKSIWNFAPIDLNVPKSVIVENISMTESLLVLSYRMNELE